MTLSDWISVITFGAGLVLIWVSGFFAGKLWQRGEYVGSVMVGEEPPPWGPDDEVVFIPEDWGISTRRGLYDFDEGRHV